MIISRWELALKGKWSLSSPGRALSITAELQIAPSGKTHGREANGSRKSPRESLITTARGRKIVFPFLQLCEKGWN